MLEVSNLKLPVDHGADAVPQAVERALMLKAGDLLEWKVDRRAVDARHASSQSIVRRSPCSPCPSG